jgi:hypothetical protein
MSHYAKQEWIQYINGKLAEDLQIELDHHLLSCNQCMNSYMECIEEGGDLLPSLENPMLFVDTIMKSLPSVHEERPAQKSKMRRFYETPIFHYSVAAAITFIFMSSGLFTQLIDLVSIFQADPVSRGSTVSNTLMHKTINLLDFIKLN